MAITSSGTLCKHQSSASRHRCRVCAVVSLAALLLLAVVAAVLALHPRPAVPTLEALRLASISLSPTGASLNATLDADLAIRNPSPVAAFTHDAGCAEVYYRGALVADADLPPGRVGAGGTEAMTVRFTVLADSLAASAAQLYGDLVGAGDVPLTVRTAVPGKATVLGMLRRRVVVVTVCDVAVSVRAPGAQTSSCRYRTKL
ncbi:hypothetical protein SEVIR_3G298900v4 [Setaria viridis]|uniref:Late embryogenesis abundant protein LEA-2 subgroup domain-containing protein n=1 Tax=Setaria viridis TaxID=4556 RepID=A0A4U6VHA4_SETVI|nr:uncharacterized protein LOC117849191 [Setaria viridis]TKW28055.1 hypothetical protein SEVIR_3G298900v2 [Setaria viridis]